MVNRRRRWLWLLLLLPVAVGAIVFFNWRKSELNLANYNRVRVGMTRQQVQDLLGPPGNHATKPDSPTLKPADPTAIADCWNTDNGAVVIYYDASGRVTGSGAAGIPMSDTPSVLATLLDKISSWFY